jgi:hypothetical protein
MSSVYRRPEVPAHWLLRPLAEFAANRGRVGTKLISATDRVRVRHLSPEPCARIGFHTHVLDYFWTAMTRDNARKVTCRTRDVSDTAGEGRDRLSLSYSATSAGEWPERTALAGPRRALHVAVFSSEPSDTAGAFETNAARSQHPNAAAAAAWKPSI